MKNNHVFSLIRVSSFTALEQDEKYAFNVRAEVPTCMKMHDTSLFFSIKPSVDTYGGVCALKST